MLDIVELIRLIGLLHQMTQSTLQATGLLDYRFGYYATILEELLDECAEQQGVTCHALYWLQQESAQPERFALLDLQTLLREYFII